MNNAEIHFRIGDKTVSEQCRLSVSQWGSHAHCYPVYGWNRIKILGIYQEYSNNMWYLADIYSDNETRRNVIIELSETLPNGTTGQIMRRGITEIT